MPNASRGCSPDRKHVNGCIIYRLVAIFGDLVHFVAEFQELRRSSGDVRVVWASSISGGLLFVTQGEQVLRTPDVSPLPGLVCDRRHLAHPDRVGVGYGVTSPGDSRQCGISGVALLLDWQ
jgi:hypothetical protein